MLTELKAKKESLQAQLIEVNEQIRIEQEEIVFEKYGVRVGSIVRNDNGKEYRVTKIEACWDIPWLYGNPKKKNGIFGIAVRSLYSNWTLDKS